MTAASEESPRGVHAACQHPGHGHAPDPFKAAVYQQTIRRNIADHGWHIQGVFGDRPEELFHYTIGLTGRGRPELWLGTLAPEQAGPLLNRIGNLSLEAPDLVQPGGEVDLGWSVPFRIRGPVDNAEAGVFLAERLFPHPTVVEVWQVLWPDEAGVFPDEDEYDAQRFPQRVLPMRGEGAS